MAQTDSNADLKAEIAPAQQKQIAAYLDYFYGTPVNPRLREIAPASENTAATEPPVEAPTAPETPEATAKAEDPAKITIPVKDRVDRQTLSLGRAVYHQQCAVCHGESGDGRGVAMIGIDGQGQYLNPPPRDYRGTFRTERATYKFTSTTLSSKPRREDLRRIIRYGAKGTSMPSFRWMPEDELEAVIDYVMHLSYRGEMEIKLLSYVRAELTPEDKIYDETVAGLAQEIAASWDEADSLLVRPLTIMPPQTPETVNAGALAFAEMNCVKCHNRDARGSKTADVGTDNWGRTAFPADLTMGTLHGGRRPVDIYRRIFTGINGTPMPGSGEPDSSKGETAEQRSERIWQLVHFITTVIEANEIPAEQQKIIDEVMARQAPPAGETAAE
ncbi:MAG TPA: c-type cytochrome [Pirellulaceae bacterium]|nr:c-type cytochrome [Pirellulaceae bacterium]